MKSRLIMFGLAVAALALFWLYDQYDRSVNYAPVLAKITSAEKLCYLSKGSRRKTTTEERPCPLVRALAASHPEYKDYTVHENVHLTYEYGVSGKSYSGSAVRNLDSGREHYSPGDALEVLVNTINPAKSQWR